MLLTRILVLVSLMGLLQSVCSAQQHTKAMTFSSEGDPFKNPVQLPPEALALLTSDKEDFPDGPPKNFHCDDQEQLHNKDEPAEQILCTKLPLSSSGEENYLVIGVGALRGAHIVPFWLIHQSNGKATILFKTRADALTVLPNSYNGYREIAATFIYGAGASIETDRFRFKGKTYKRISTRVDRQ